MSVIDNFIKQYEKEYDFYKQLARLGNDILETEIMKRGIKAIVSNRAKRPDRLREKLQKRNSEKNYKSKITIEKDIIDLAGIRVALYFPSDEEIVGETIKELFDIQETKNFPENSHQPKHNKRFSGYWATHYRVTLKKSDDIDERFTSTVFEIQVASVLMHAWSEVEHDLVYKPFSGSLSESELAILDEINGLVLIGEIALERLRKAITERTQKQSEITDKYDLTNFIFSNYEDSFKKINLGNTEYLNNFLKAINKIDTSQIKNALKNINLNINESFSDQLFDSIFRTTNDSNIHKYFSQITPDKIRISFFELFIKTWILFEKVIAQISKEFGNNNIVNVFSKIEELNEILRLTKDQIEKVKSLRKIRNEILHGNASINNTELERYYNNLKNITQECLIKIKDNKIKNELQKEFEELTS